MSYEDTLIREMTDETPPNDEDACPVCDKIDCECPPETYHGIVLDHPLKKHFPVPAFPSLLESAEHERIVEYNRSQFGPPR